ncbi:Hypothetical predicted protein [Marmota monax]|uniref:G-protein coupled receptors family 1 profile domain-containing protein n=1 Tax=Marmota monax TaxID=9995 RepID=A0A5E4CKG0_MARMO|nr:hypothetical protein GHT09_013170 [Marmota monax]VTJ82354.1 Hypothetical predicted protein [Marmota monax]
MYFLLSQLSLMDLMYIYTTVPKMTYNFLSGQKSISFLGCGVQSFFFLSMAGSEGVSAPQQRMSLAVFYTILTPMLNPIIYSLRNKEVLGAMGRVCGMFSPRKK